MSHDREAAIREKARAIWEREGRPDGHHERHWIEAERQLSAEAEAAKSKSGNGVKKSAAAKGFDGEGARKEDASEKGARSKSQIPGGEIA